VLSRELGDTVEPGFEALVAKARHGQPEQREWHFLRKDRTRVPVLLSVSALRNAVGEIIGFLGIASDITARKAAESAYQESQRRIELAARGTNDGLWEWDLSSDVVWYSERFKALLGHTDAEFPNEFRSWAQSLHPDDSHAATEALQRHLREGLPYDVEYRCRTRTGQYRWFRARGAAERDAEGQPVRMAGSITDITQRKADQQELIRVKNEAEAANRAKSEFLANMSHEIRTPMTAIIGYTDMIAHAPHDPDQIAEWNRSIRRNGTHLLTLINDILDLSKIEAGGLSVADETAGPMELLRQAEATMRALAAEKGLALTVRQNGPLPQAIRTDAMRFKQILINLLSNAVKFTDSGGITVNVGLERTGVDDRLRLVVSVADTGIGIAPDAMKDLFKPFTQVHQHSGRRFGGTGLGLDISYRLAHLLGGGLEARSALGRGSIFTFWIDAPHQDRWVLVEPDHGAEGKPLEEQSETPEAALLDGVRILVADDNPDNQRIIDFILKRAGAHVEIVQDGAHALVAHREAEITGRSFDAVLMDMQMPVMDGFEATTRLRRQNVRTPIIALTAYAMVGDQAKCLGAGCDAYVPKPIVPETLIHEILRHMSPETPVEAGAAPDHDAPEGDRLPGPLRSAMDGLEGFEPILLEYVGELPEMIERLRDHQTHGQAQLFQKLVHRVRGTAGSFGFPDISEAAGMCEDALRNGRPIGELNGQVDRLLHLMSAAVRGYDVESSDRTAADEHP